MRPDTTTSYTGNGQKGKRRQADYFLQNKAAVDYKDMDVLRKFLSPEGKILPCRRTGLTAKNQRKLARSIKQARMINFLPFVECE